jgi:hypothetical protein
MHLWPLLVIPALCLSCTAQSTASARQKTTTVTGHVYCADTNAPARFASVMLEPVSLIEKPHLPGGKNEGHAEIMVTAVETTLDGSFTLPKVSPGTYYVIAYKAGYLSPLATFPSDVLEHPSDEDRKRIAATVPKMTIEAGLPASIDLRLERGAAISGTVLFDDGSPAAGLAVHALVRTSHGHKERWSPLPPTPFAMSTDTRTDDLGRYRLAGLAPRDYILQADLELQDADFGMTSGGMATTMMYRPGVTISFFSGETARKRNAVPFKLTGGEERSGEDMTIPVSKLHNVSGELRAAHDGHLLTGGNVQLLDPEDKSVIEFMNLTRSDSRFHFTFVPEGRYILRVSGAADVTYEDVPYPPGTMPPTHEEAHTLRSYGSLDESLNVHDDIPILTISVPDKSAALPASPASP